MASADLRLDSAHPIASPRQFEPATLLSATTAAIITGVMAGLLIVLYQSSFSALTAAWRSEPTYSFGFLIPLLSLIAAAAAWRRVGAPVRSDVAPADLRGGLFVVVLGIAIHAAALVVDHVSLDVAGLVLMIRGTIRICGGRECMRAYDPAAFLLLFLIPVSPEFFAPLAPMLVRGTAFVAGALLDLVRVPVFVDGAIVQLVDFNLIVTPETCGVRELEGASAVCLATAFTIGRGKKFGAILVLASLPIVVGVNVVRYAAAGLTRHWRGRAAAEQLFAGFDGPTIVGITVVLVALTTLALLGAATLLPSRKRS